jgi:hypothetical protein
VLTDAAYAVLPMDGGSKFVSNEVRAKVRYQPYSDSLFRFDLDAAAITYAGDGFSTRPGAAARQALRVRELRMAYGVPSNVRAALGRLGAASSLVGQLDGARLDIALGERLRLSTFGGLSPQTFSGVPSTDVARFGGELGYEDPASVLQPRLVLGAHASRFDGALDERKVYAAFDLLPPKGRLGAFGEVSFFDADDPWNARRVELTAASLEGTVQIDVFFLGTRLDLRRPDRSRYLQSLLPREWLCWAEPARPGAPCVREAATYSWMVDGGARIGKFSLDIGGQSRFTRGTDATNFGGFANLRWIDLVGKLHLDAGMSAYSGSVLRSVALSIAPGLDFADGDADLTLRYRPAIVRDRATLRTGVEHTVGAGFWLSPHDSVDLDLEADWIRGGPIDAITAQALFGWRLGG